MGQVRQMHDDGDIDDDQLLIAQIGVAGAVFFIIIVNVIVITLFWFCDYGFAK